MRTKINKNINAINLFVTLLFLLPVTKLDLFHENYSTLSLNTRGYLYVLIVGNIIGILLAYETYYLTNYKNAILMYLSLFIGTIVPHHVPYNLQGNLHLLFAYIGFALLVIISVINIFYNRMVYLKYYLFFIFVAIVFYLRYSMVNTISEVIVMLDSIVFNMLLYNLKKGDRL